MALEVDGKKQRGKGEREEVEEGEEVETARMKEEEGDEGRTEVEEGEPALVLRVGMAAGGGRDRGAGRGKTEARGRGERGSEDAEVGRRVWRAGRTGVDVRGEATGS